MRIRTSPAAAYSRLRRAAVAALVVGTAGIAGLTSQASAEPSTMKVTGHVETLLGGGPDCSAPAGLCFAGDIKGVVRGRPAFRP